MSGIAGLVRDAAPVDAQTVARMVARMRRRGPDGHGVWHGDHVALGLAHLDTTGEGAEAGRPCVWGDVVVVADARLDGRDDLRRALAAAGEDVDIGAADARLIAHAYRAWGETCVDRLIGDFAFAVWDRCAKRLFCARDHFGVRPFFYAVLDDGLMFASAIESIHAHARVSRSLDDRAIADFLLFKYSRNPAATVFADIRRLPPAHRLAWSPERGGSVQRYWTLQPGSPIRHRSTSDYVAHFVTVFDQAVRDRLRGGRVGVSMSGGLDSSTIAAAASGAFSSGQTDAVVSAHTVVFDRLLPDRERVHASAVSSHLGLPQHFFLADDCPLFSGAVDGDPPTPEPCDALFRSLELGFHSQMAESTRVVLHGLDADAWLSERTFPHFQQVLHEDGALEAGRAMARYASYFKRRPPLGLSRVRNRLMGDTHPMPALPSWVSPDLLQRLCLVDQWREHWSTLSSSPTRRPIAAAATTMWTTEMWRQSPESTRQSIEYRYPFMDVRLAAFLLAIPVVPWCTDKSIVREALRGVLPEEIRRRPKAPLAGDPVTQALGTAGNEWIDQFESAPEFERFVIRSSVPPLTGAHRIASSADLRALCLNRWLETQDSSVRGGESDVVESHHEERHRVVLSR